MAFLRWALPRMGMRWAGFRKVRGGVCKRIGRRLSALGLRDPAAYRLYLEANPAEWGALEGMCRVSISRFYRDRGVFECLKDTVLPAIAGAARRGGGEIRCWCAGCASGEEAWTLSMIWRLAIGERFAGPPFRVLATDTDEHLLSRAEAGRYPPSSLKELPGAWRDLAFDRKGGAYCLKAPFREGVRFERQDIRREAPGGAFHLILCRNLAFTYFDDGVQREVLERILTKIRPGGFLVAGSHERLPAGEGRLERWPEGQPIYRLINGVGE
ncbi:CheR family methyltransferase [Nitrospinota bacterium]